MSSENLFFIDKLIGINTDTKFVRIFRKTTYGFLGSKNPFKIYKKQIISWYKGKDFIQYNRSKVQKRYEFWTFYHSILLKSFVPNPTAALHCLQRVKETCCIRCNGIYSLLLFNMTEVGAILSNDLCLHFVTTTTKKRQFQ